MKLEHIIVLQNKIDIAIRDKHAVKMQQQEIRQKFGANPPPIVPISAQMRYNIDIVVDYLCRIPIPRRQFTVPPYFIVIRSFDVNSPGTEAEKLVGGVAGGTILRGCLQVG